MGAAIWMTQDHTRFYLIPDSSSLQTGSLVIKSLDGRIAAISNECAGWFEITEEQARRIAKDQLGRTLDQLKLGIDERLAELRNRLDERDRTPVRDDTPLTPNAAPALFEFLRKLPGVIVNSLAHDAQRVESAKTMMADLQRRLNEAGIDLDHRFTAFPERLAQLREDESKPQP